jgi:hypothetical protein
MYFLARLRIDLQISIFGFSHKLLVFRIYPREYVKSARYTPLMRINYALNCVNRAKKRDFYIFLSPFDAFKLLFSHFVLIRL